MDFDPSVVSYEKLLELALASHDPFRPAYREQYASLVLTHDDQQAQVARIVSKRLELDHVRRLATRIEPLKHFYLAEDYHQKYYLRNDRVLFGEFRSMFCDDETALRESTAAARVNSYVAGEGTRAQLAREIEFLGLSDAGQARLISRVADEPTLGATRGIR